MQAKNELPSLLRARLPRDHPETDFDPQKYRPRCARDAVKLRLLGATAEELAKWFGVHEFFLEQWASEHADFEKVLKVAPNGRARHSTSFGSTRSPPRTSTSRG